MRPAAVCSVVFDGEGRVLLQKRRDNGHWALPGGQIELDETAADACIREIEEETGCKTEVVRLIGVYSDPARTTVAYPDGNVIQYVSVCFECRWVEGEPSASDEASESRWFEHDEAQSVVWDIHVDRLANGLAGAVGVHT